MREQTHHKSHQSIKLFEESSGVVDSEHGLIQLVKHVGGALHVIDQRHQDVGDVGGQSWRVHGLVAQALLTQFSEPRSRTDFIRVN